MTAPELQRVIEEAIAGEAEYPVNEHIAAQARAVLDALAEAGQVEWGALHRKRKVPYRYAKEQDARNSAKANHGVLVSRLTLPWVAE